MHSRGWSRTSWGLPSSLRLVAPAITAGTLAASFEARARADDGPPIVVQGPAVASFTSRAQEGQTPRETPDVASLVDGLPGVRVRRLGVDGGFATLTIRGAASHQIGVTLAGVPLTGAADPSLDLSTIPLWPGATVRVHRSFAPASLGGGYLGGLVQIDPVDPSVVDRLHPSHTEVYGAVGSFGALRERVSDVRRVGDDAVVATAFSESRWGGAYPYLDPSGGPGHEVERTRQNAGYAQIGAVAHARIDDGAWTWLATALGSSRRDGSPGSYAQPTLFTELIRDRVLFAVEGRRTDDAGRWIARFWGRRDLRVFDDPRGEEVAPGGSASDTTSLAGVTFGRSTRVGDRLSIDARLEGSIEHALDTRIDADDVTRTRSQGAFALDANFRATRDVELALAARADLRHDAGDATALGADVTEVLPVAHLGVEARAVDEPQIRIDVAAHAGFLARPPSFLELLGDGGVYAPSPHLQSEHASAIDAGFRGNARVGAADATFELVGFASQMRDQIVVLATGVGTLRSANVGTAIAAGGEATGAIRLRPITLLASYTFLHTEDRTSDAVSRGQPLPDRPAHDLTGDALLTVDRFTLHYGVDFVSSTNLDRAGTNVLPSHLEQSIGVRVQLLSHDRLILAGEIDNLFDVRTANVLAESGALPIYQRYPIVDFLGYPIVGRRWTISIRAKLP